MPRVQILSAALLLTAAAAMGDYNEAHEASEVKALRKYIKSRGGVVSDNIKVVADEWGGRGVVAVGGGVETGELLMSIPWELTLVGSNEKQTEEEDLNMGELHLFLRVLKERHDPKSEHRVYLRTMPAVYTNGVYFDEKDLQCLSPNSKVHHQHTINQLERFGAIALEVQKTQPESFAGAAKFSREELFDAYSAVFTRALRSGKDTVLIPFFDMLNHNGNPSAAVQFTEVGVTVSAVRDMGPGEELTISYGGHLSPAALLVYYGFADDSFTNVSSHFNFEVNERTQPLVKAGCSNQQDLVIYRDGTLSPKLVECLVLTVLPQANRTEYPDLPASEQAEIVEANRLTALQVYGKHLVTITTQYPSAYDSPCDSTDGHIPIIQGSNDLIREVYLAAKQKIDDEVRESGAAEVEVKGKGKRRRRQQDAEDEDEDEEDVERL
eukprot:TRINITY_DN2287_c0_g1_i1.p1 TRINITY_DN2287_c0_g1~~TRINITY_DN2287_c0_g1_i1.p1  ORF type:complete len:464 (+),score=123.83 TRINITY_DN2287_c0_g1_i1:81-1394(+)